QDWQCNPDAGTHPANPITPPWRRKRASVRSASMTTKEFIALAKSLMLDLPGFTFKGRLMFIKPVKQVLRGICFEPSAFDKRAFYVNVFALPLCVPTRHLYFNFGKRV